MAIDISKLSEENAKVWMLTLKGTNSFVLFRHKGKKIALDCFI